MKKVDINFKMKFFLEKIVLNDLNFIILTLSLVLLPVVCKLMINGLLGPSFNFYFFIIWIPTISITSATLRGWQESALTAILIVLAFLISFVIYPQNPLMDFRRQIVHQSYSLISIAVLISLVLQVSLKRKFFFSYDEK